MPSIGDAFDTFTHDATRIEALPAFLVPEEADALKAVQEGRQPDFAFMQEWYEYLEGVVASGRMSRRLRLVSDPLTDYEHMEVAWGYPANAEHGEEIRIMPRSDAPSDMKDYWTFDGALVFEMLYDEDGAFVGSEHVESEKASRILAWLTQAWGTSTDLADFGTGK